MDILIWRTETPRSQICVYLAYIECWLEWHTNYIQDVWWLVVGGGQRTCKWKSLETSVSIDDYPASYITCMHCAGRNENQSRLVVSRTTLYLVVRVGGVWNPGSPFIKGSLILSDVYHHYFCGRTLLLLSLTFIIRRKVWKTLNTNIPKNHKPNAPSITIRCHRRPAASEPAAAAAAAESLGEWGLAT